VVIIKLSIDTHGEIEGKGTLVNVKQQMIQKHVRAAIVAYSFVNYQLINFVGKA
jgi:hypothetical protein